MISNSGSFIRFRFIYASYCVSCRIKTLYAEVFRPLLDPEYVGANKNFHHRWMSLYDCAKTMRTVCAWKTVLFNTPVRIYLNHLHSICMHTIYAWVIVTRLKLLERHMSGTLGCGVYSWHRCLPWPYFCYIGDSSPKDCSPPRDDLYKTSMFRLIDFIRSYGSLNLQLMTVSRLFHNCNLLTKWVSTLSFKLVT